MIVLFYSHLSRDQKAGVFHRIHATLPSEFRQAVEKYRRPEDRLRSLVSKYLLLEALAYFKVNQPYRYAADPEMSKPRLEGPENFSFNLTHSGDLVVCAAARGMRLGVDIEKVRPAPDILNSGIFSTEELADLDAKKCTPEAYLQLWTRKEALAKADGRGLKLVSGETDVLGDCAEVDGLRFELTHLKNIPPGYVGALAYQNEGRVSEIDLREVALPSV